MATPANQSQRPNRPPPPPGYYDVEAKPAGNRPPPPPGYYDADNSSSFSPSNEVKKQEVPAKPTVDHSGQSHESADWLHDAAREMAPEPVVSPEHLTSMASATRPKPQPKPAPKPTYSPEDRDYLHQVAEDAVQSGTGPESIPDRFRRIASTQGVGRALQEPIVSAEKTPLPHDQETEQYLAGMRDRDKRPKPKGPLNLATPEAAGAVVHGLEDTAKGLTSPANLAIGAATEGLGAVPGIAGNVLRGMVSGYFTEQMLADAYHKVPEIKAAAERGDSAEVARLVTEAGLDVGMGAASGLHAGKETLTGAARAIDKVPSLPARGEAAPEVLRQPDRADLARSREPIVRQEAPRPVQTETVAPKPETKPAKTETHPWDALPGKEPQIIASRVDGEAPIVHNEVDLEDVKRKGGLHEQTQQPQQAQPAAGPVPGLRPADQGGAGGTGQTGRGLRQAQLSPEAGKPGAYRPVSGTGAVVRVPIKEIGTDSARFQPRRGVNPGRVEAIRQNMERNGEFGDKFPLDVWRDPQNGSLKVMAGHHRLEAAKLAGLSEVSAKIHDDLTAEQAEDFARRSNSQAAPLTPMENGRAFQSELDRGRTPDVISKEYGGISATKVLDLATLTKLPAELQDRIQDGTLEPSMGIALAKGADRHDLPPEMLAEVYDKIIKTTEMTPTELGRMLDTLAPAAAKQIKMGLGFELPTGFMDPLKDYLKTMRDLNSSRNKMRAYSNEIEKMQRTGQTVTRAEIRAKELAVKRVEKLQAQVAKMERDLGRGKLPSAGQLLQREKIVGPELKPAPREPRVELEQGIGGTSRRAPGSELLGDTGDEKHYHRPKYRELEQAGQGMLMEPPRKEFTLEMQGSPLSRQPHDSTREQGGLFGEGEPEVRPEPSRLERETKGKPIDGLAGADRQPPSIADQDRTEATRQYGRLLGRVRETEGQIHGTVVDSIADYGIMAGYRRGEIEADLVDAGISRHSAENSVRTSKAVPIAPPTPKGSTNAMFPGELQAPSPEAEKAYALAAKNMRKGGQEPTVESEGFKSAFDKELNKAAKKGNKGGVSLYANPLFSKQAWTDALGYLAPADVTSPGEMGHAILREETGKTARLKEQMYHDLKSERTRWEKRSPDAMLAFVDAMENGPADRAARGVTLSPATQARLTAGLRDLNAQDGQLAGTLRQLLDDGRTAVQNLGTGRLQQFIQDYFPHIWEKPGRVTQFVQQMMGKKPLAGAKSFLKTRTIPTTAEGVDFGLKPVDWNPVNLALLKMQEMNRYVMSENMRLQGKASGLVKFSRTRNGAPQGWVRVDPWDIYNWDNTANGLIYRGSYYAPADFAKSINRYLSPGLRGTAGYDLARGFGNLLNQVQLGMSGFHLGTSAINGVVGQVSLAARQLAHGNVLSAGKSLLTAPLAPVTMALRGRKLMAEYLDPGSLAKYNKTADALAQAGGRIAVDPLYQGNAIESVAKSWRTGSKVAAILKTPFAVIEAQARPVMGYAMRMKLGSFHDMASEALGEAQKHNWSPEQTRAAVQKAWDSADNRFGQLVYDNLNWNRVVKDLSQAGLRSVGWNYGTIRELGGGLTDIPRQAGAALTGKGFQFTDRMAYTFALPVVVGMMGAVYQYMHTGTWPQETRDYFYPKNGRKTASGEDDRVSFPSYMKDVYAYSQHPVDTVGHKVSPGAAMIAEMLENQDYYGTEIRHQDDPLIQQVGQELNYMGKQFVPFSARNVMERTGSAELGEGLRKSAENPGKSAESFMGIVPAPRATVRTEAENLVRRYMQEDMPAGTRTAEEAAHGRATAEWRSKLANGEATRADIAHAVQSGQMTQREGLTLLKEQHTPALVGQSAHLNLYQLLRVYDVASDKEKAQLKPVLTRKANNPASFEAMTADQRKQIMAAVRGVLHPHPQGPTYAEGGL